MKNTGKFLIAVLIFAAFNRGGAVESGDDDYYYKINKSFEIYGAVFRELAKNYVLEIDPDVLMRKGIDGMLEGLDPYTSYIDGSSAEDIDMLTSGAYVGFGIQVGVRDSMLTITGVAEGYSAEQSGVRIGDRLYKIDSTVVISLKSSQVRKYTKGDPGSFAEIWLFRDGLDDTLKLVLERKEIEIRNVSYFGILDGGVAYIKLDRFSRLSANEVKNALDEMKKQTKLKGIVLDLRNNPGGLLDAAISVAELFLPDGSPVVSTRGRYRSDNYEYKAARVGHDTTTPLAVLINGRSASASEVVAGAIQDLDRGVVIGTRSYGKGLVQSVFDLPHRSNLKITTAKYYTPSGRCIQRIDYFHENGKALIKDNPIDSVFRTKNGRPVYESKGISPDSTVMENEDYSEYVQKIYRENLFFNFANIYAAKNLSVPEEFEVDETILKDFRNYLADKNFAYENEVDKNLREMKKIADEEKLSKKTLELISTLEKRIDKEKMESFEKYRKEIKDLLGDEIYRRRYPNSKTIRRIIEADNVVNTAADILISGKCKEILTLTR